MKTPRLLAATALAAALAFGLSACGSDDDDDDVVPAATSSSTTETAPSADAGTTAPDASSVPPANDEDDVTDEALRTRLAEAALAEVGQGRVSDIENSDDRSHAYEVDVDLDNGEDVTVELAEDLSVVRVDR